MKLIKEIINHFQRKSIHPLGRWRIEYNTRIINHKIDMSNEDHCGPCGQYIINTPLKIYNGTAKAVPLEIQGQPLPINELNGTPPLEACPISNLHRCKNDKKYDENMIKNEI